MRRAFSLWHLVRSAVAVGVLLSAEGAVILAIDVPSFVSAAPHPPRRYAGPVATRRWEARVRFVDPYGGVSGQRRPDSESPGNPILGIESRVDAPP
jgi:hypothetical protein